MRKLGLGLIAAAVLTPLEASAEWMDIGTSINESVWSIDPARVKVVGGKVHAWVKVDASKDRTVTWRESKRLFSLDCSEDKFRMLSYVNYDSYGKIVSSNSYSDYGYGVGYDPIIPDSMVESVAKLACIVLPAKSSD
jgi:hypothetical protein